MPVEQIFLDERNTKLLSIASRVHQASVLLSNLLPEERIIENLEDLQIICDFFRVFGMKIVLTMGTFDLFHIGHARYIAKARSHGTLLIVGLEDDKKARARKGENRPVVPYIERSELLTFLRHADIIAQKAHDQQKWAMIKVVKPDVLIAVEGTYVPEELIALDEFCEEVVVLPRQAETSTSAKIRKLVLDGADNFTALMIEKMPEVIRGLYDQMKNGGPK
jgi:D-beta-D-heptose 7-phosphate kinase/D-beta-D-heptose 1-phosphate adenosyltransferase